MKDLDNRVAELLRRTKKTTRSRFRASERLDRHHKFSQWTVALLSVALIFLPLSQSFGVVIELNPQYINAIQAFLAVLLLTYSLLLGQERYISRSEAMHRNGVELGKFARKVAGFNDEATDEQYKTLVEEYYSIIEKYENHTPLDYLFTRLHDVPESFSKWPQYILLWLKAQIMRIFIYSHYVFVTFVSFYVIYKVIIAVKVT